MLGEGQIKIDCTPYTRDISVCIAGCFLTGHIMDSTEKTLSSIASQG